MGTRADFYVGRGPEAEWIGSVAWDGGWIEDEPSEERALLKATDEVMYRDIASEFFAERDDSTLPEQGWPWPWDTSDTTDCAYAFDDGKVWMTWGGFWFDPLIDRDEDGEVVDEAKDAVPVEWPDMSARKNVTFGLRSGLITLIGGGS